MSSEAIQLSDEQARELFTKGSLKDVVAFYKKHGTNFALPFNSNPLHYAAMNIDHPIVILYLLKYWNLKIQVNDIDDFDSHPLQLAAKKENLKGIEYLIYYGADYESKYKCGETLQGIFIRKMESDLISCLNGIIEGYKSGQKLADEDKLSEEIAEINVTSTPQKVKYRTSSYFSGFLGLFHPVVRMPSQSSQERELLLNKKQQ